MHGWCIDTVEYLWLVQVLIQSSLVLIPNFSACTGCQMNLTTKVWFCCVMRNWSGYVGTLTHSILSTRGTSVMNALVFTASTVTYSFMKLCTFVQVVKNKYIE